MRLDIQKLLAAVGSSLDFDFSFPVTLIDDVKDASAHVSGRLYSRGGYAELKAETLLKGTGVCARCRREFPLELRFSTERPVAKPPSDDPDCIAVDEDGFLSLQPVFEEEAVLQCPSKLLCTENCKGLCPRCGADLNEGSCGCPRKEADARLEILKNFL